MDSNEPLPQIKVDLKRSISVVKNAIQRSEGKIIQYVKEVSIINQKRDETPLRSSATATNKGVSVVQEMGFSETSVMSQNAVTEAINAVEENIAEVTQYMGQSTEKVMSQKAVTNELQKLSNNMVEVVQETGDSNLTVMSQKATTNAIDGVDKVLTFDGFIEEAEISLQVNPYDGGKIYFVRSANIFAYYREQDGFYTAMWNGFTRYATFVPQQGVIPNSDRIFVYNNELYLWDGETLVSIGKTSMPIERIVTSGTITLNTDIKYMVKISGDTTFLLQYNNDTNNNHYYKIFLETEGTVPIIEFPSNVLWANEKVFLPNSKYIITIEDNILSYIKVEKPIYYSFSTAFSNDFKVFK
jgi:hypothetical protein